MRPAAWRRRWSAGFWAALLELFPETAEQRCWQHKVVADTCAMPRQGPITERQKQTTADGLVRVCVDGLRYSAALVPHTVPDNPTAWEGQLDAARGLSWAGQCASIGL